MENNKYTWNQILLEEVNKPYFKKIQEILLNERLLGATIYPPKEMINNAYKLTQFNKIKVVIIGQDPYHNPNQAHGLSFSVPDGIKPPPSLKNIFLEINSSCNIPIPKTGNLTTWANQGVFLLNSILTVRANEPASHNKIGWQQFTDFTISEISNKLNHIVFMLWGNYAQQKSFLIDQSKHLILKAAHPSPFSAHRGFLGCNHFKLCNDYFQMHEQKQIDWSL